MASDVFDGKLLAFKGATAIDQFIRDMPRFSLYLDLVHVKHMTPRKVPGGENRGILKIALDGVASLRHLLWLFKTGC